MKTSGFNLKDLGKSNEELDTLIEMKEDNHNMQKELRLKKKKKFNFDSLFPAPKHNENMGMDNIFKGDPFEGIL